MRGGLARPVFPPDERLPREEARLLGAAALRLFLGVDFLDDLDDFRAAMKKFGSKVVDFKFSAYFSFGHYSTNGQWDEEDICCIASDL
jgi:hypothetical protein